MKILRRKNQKTLKFDEEQTIKLKKSCLRGTLNPLLCADSRTTKNN